MYVRRRRTTLTILNDPALAYARAYCTEIIKTKAHSFYFASRFLPADKRQDVFALYAFCRTVDDIADLPQQGAAAGTTILQLQRWRAWLVDGATARDDDPVKYALGQVVRDHDLPLQPLLDLVDAVCEDLDPRHLPDFLTLERYCHGVAGTVGIAMAALLGARDPDALIYARDLGIAMQLTNVLRDVGEDLARGRVYLPADEMARFGYQRDDLERGVLDERFIELMRFHVARARHYYSRGSAGLRYLPRDSQFPIAVAARTYAGILTKIERANFDVFTRRARTGRRDKLLLAANLYTHRWRGAATQLDA